MTRALGGAVVVWCLLQGAACGPTDQAWFTIHAERQARDGEVPFEELTGYLRIPADPDHVPGPRGMTLIVDRDAGRPPQVTLHLADGSSRALLTEPATEPRWAPDGAHAAVLAWTGDHRQRDNLRIVAIDGGTVLAPSLGSAATGVKWSPNSQRLAVAAIDGRRRVLCAVAMPDGAVVRLPGSGVALDDCSWRLDSTWLALARTGDGAGGTAADVWLVAADDGRRFRLTHTPRADERHPLWIDNDSLMLERHLPGGAAERVVFDVRVAAAGR